MWLNCVCTRTHLLALIAQVEELNYPECILTGCPVGTVHGWVGQEVSVVEHSRQYPHSLKPHPHTSTH